MGEVPYRNPAIRFENDAGPYRFIMRIPERILKLLDGVPGPRASHFQRPSNQKTVWKPFWKSTEKQGKTKKAKAPQPKQMQDPCSSHSQDKLCLHFPFKGKIHKMIDLTCLRIHEQLPIRRHGTPRDLISLLRHYKAGHILR